MKASSKGRRAEHRVRHLLEAVGYTCVRSAGSKGPVDLIAWSGSHFRLIQVKSGARAEVSPQEREAFALLAVPDGTSKELWRLRDRQPPLIEVL